MKYAADFRFLARNALRGKWLSATLVGIVAAFFGGEIAGGGGGGSSSSERSDFSTVREYAIYDGVWEAIGPYLVGIVIVALILLLASLVLGGGVSLGYARYNLNLVDHREARLSDLFSQFDRLWTGFCMRFLTGLYTILWSFLFVIPGLIKSYSYAMTPYILSEHPGMTANEAITRSREIMDGNKWRLFCLGFSFIGWDLLCSAPILIAGYAFALNFYLEPWKHLWLIPISIPLGIGYWFLRPYREAAYAAFYRDVSGTERYIPFDSTVEF